MLSKGRMTPEREVPALARPKARPRKWWNQLLTRALPTTPPQIWVETQATVKSRVNRGRLVVPPSRMVAMPPVNAPMVMRRRREWRAQSPAARGMAICPTRVASPMPTLSSARVQPLRAQRGSIKAFMQ